MMSRDWRDRVRPREMVADSECRLSHVSAATVQNLDLSEGRVALW